MPDAPDAQASKVALDDALEGLDAPARPAPIPDEMRELLHGQELCVLATVFMDIPHASLMGYAASKDCRRLYMVSEPGTKKVANLRRNPQVGVLVDSRAELGADGAGRALALTIKGLAGEMEPGPERDKALRALWQRPYLRELVGALDVVVIKVEVESLLLLTGVSEARYLEV